MQVNTELLWNALEQMQFFIRRKEELQQDLEHMLVKCEQWKILYGYEELKQCEEEMKQQIQMEKEMQNVLEKIVRNYEQTERKMFRLQEEGIRTIEHTKIACINVEVISSLLEQWDLIGE